MVILFLEYLFIFFSLFAKNFFFFFAGCFFFFILSIHNRKLSADSDFTAPEKAEFHWSTDVVWPVWTCTQRSGGNAWPGNKPRIPSTPTNCRHTHTQTHTGPAGYWLTCWMSLSNGCRGGLLAAAACVSAVTLKLTLKAKAWQIFNVPPIREKLCPHFYSSGWNLAKLSQIICWTSRGSRGSPRRLTANLIGSSAVGLANELINPTAGAYTWRQLITFWGSEVAAGECRASGILPIDGRKIHKCWRNNVLTHFSRWKASLLYQHLWVWTPWSTAARSSTKRQNWQWIPGTVFKCCCPLWFWRGPFQCCRIGRRDRRRKCSDPAKTDISVAKSYWANAVMYWFGF